MSYPAQVEGLVNMDRSLTGTTTENQGGPGSNDNEGVLLFPQNASPSAAV